MIRSEKEIKDADVVAEVIRKCEVCRVAMTDGMSPYIVPVSFGFDGKVIYFHSGTKGMKIDYIEKNPRVCFEFESGVSIIGHDTKPCGWSCSFQSVIGFGEVVELKVDDEKRMALGVIMAQYSDSKWDLKNIPLKGVRLWKINIESMRGKQSNDFADKQ